MHLDTQPATNHRSPTMRHRDALLELISPALARARRERQVRVRHPIPRPMPHPELAAQTLAVQTLAVRTR
ncbi:MAG: hypothetical protein A2V85_04905 [Chloroflexi bacterium RBG_16_72_14]|nr:MAG: hypothetical protein A2V85_04905 [Chloroflexi bacterium RBG_16_72_14]